MILVIMVGYQLILMFFDATLQLILSCSLTVRWMLAEGGDPVILTWYTSVQFVAGADAWDRHLAELKM